MWYWYFTGMMTAILFMSILANIGLAQGWIVWKKATGSLEIDPDYDRNPRVYDWSHDLDKWRDKDSELF